MQCENVEIEAFQLKNITNIYNTMSFWEQLSSCDKDKI